MNLTTLLFTPRLIAALVFATGLPLVLVVLFLGGSPPRTASAAAPGTPTTRLQSGQPPRAAEFAGQFIGVSNQYAKEHRDATRIRSVHCVEAAAGRYMCSYSATKPHSSSHCQLMQARWTPKAASTFTVTLSGRTKACRSLSEAIRTLR